MRFQDWTEAHHRSSGDNSYNQMTYVILFCVSLAFSYDLLDLHAYCAIVHVYSLQFLTISHVKNKHFHHIQWETDLRSYKYSNILTITFNGQVQINKINIELVNSILPHIIIIKINHPFFYRYLFS